MSERRKRDRLRRLVRAVGTLGTVPGFIALIVWSTSFVTLLLDSIFHEALRGLFGGAIDLPYETAKTLLSTVASGSLTTLGLVYSIVLVVFTTAAGNIGPRLLQRFTGDRINQVTAGLFGGAFLYSLTIMYALVPDPTGERADNAQWDGVPILSVAFAFALSLLAVLQLILFVSRAARSVTVDVEVSEIAERLEDDLRTLCDRSDDQPPGADWPEGRFDPVDVVSSGYVATIERRAAARWARENGRRIELMFGAGDFVMQGETLLKIERGAHGAPDEELREELREFVVVEPSRSPEADVEFSINLLVEIALRALSPGVNDTYTAIACVDRLSSALAVVVRNRLPGEVLVLDGEPALRIPGISFDGLVSAAFGPLRRAANDNLLMTSQILKALLRLHEACPDAVRRRRFLKEAGRIFEAFDLDGMADEDVRYLRRLKARFYRKADAEGRAAVSTQA